jgi:sporulation protein YlmC with PRC-barrel domain
MGPGLKKQSLAVGPGVPGRIGSLKRCRDVLVLDMSVLSTQDEGKVLMDEQGEQIGVVTEVDLDENVAYVEPDPGVAEAVIQGLGMGDADEDDIQIPGESVETITDTELRVPRDL